jgi:hypothetical protein
MPLETCIPLPDDSPNIVRVPAPTAWPMALAFGVLLLLGGLATGAALSVLGAAVALSGLVGWFREVLPREAHEQVPIAPPPAAALTTRREVIHLQAVSGSPRASLPVEVHPISAGVIGGLAGGLAMAVLALLHGVLSGHGIWYPINLLSAGFFPGAVAQSTGELSHFHAGATLIGAAIHLFASIIVGLLYGAMLPILPRRPILLGGMAVPLVWSALFYGIVGIVNPVLEQRVSWPWFVACQVGFGAVAGAVVARRERVKTWQGAPLFLRAGLEAIGLERKPHGEKKP